MENLTVVEIEYDYIQDDKGQDFLGIIATNNTQYIIHIHNGKGFIIKSASLLCFSYNCIISQWEENC